MIDQSNKFICSQLNTLGLLPTHVSDWVSSLAPAQVQFSHNQPSTLLDVGISIFHCLHMYILSFFLFIFLGIERAATVQKSRVLGFDKESF